MVFSFHQVRDFWLFNIEQFSKSNAVLASTEYFRGDGGEPVKIIREDGSYVKVDYDNSLRVIKETYFDSNHNQTEEIAYSYDAQGNRAMVSSGKAAGNYSYDNVHQLTDITTPTGNETYTYDAGGRIKSITRDGETWNLEYNTADLITSITDSAGNVVVEYEYDSNGRRVEATDSSGNRNYLVASMGNSDLESPHLVTDENGNLISAYVYGGAMPLMRLDAQGNPVYYLTDAMGSVIGLADGSGVEVADFRYDSFGNLRSSTGIEGDREVEAGGDFRFQGQWKESTTDLYHFRARYYDPESGRFISRDSVDYLEYEPESSNPYQFVYHNPLVYSDPSGAIITLGDLGVSNKIQNILRNYESIAARAIQQQLRNEIEGVATDLAVSILKNAIPFANFENHTLFDIPLSSVDQPFENAITNTLCDVITSTMPNFFGLNYLWIKAEISPDGHPVESGINPSPTPGTSGCGISFSQGTGGNTKPELIIKKEPPTDTTTPSYLLAEVKTKAKNIETGSSSQHIKFVKYAKGKDADKNQYMFVPAILYVSLEGDAKKEADITKKSLKKGIFVEFISFVYR